MQSALLEDPKLKKEIRAFLTSHPDVIDAFIFGSAVRGKDMPSDMDVLLLFNQELDLDAQFAFRKMLERFSLPVHVTSKTYAGLMDPLFPAREGILSEGYSVRQECFLHEGFGFATSHVFTYSLQGKTASERVRFYYALNGRGSEGVLKSSGGRRLSDSTVMIPPLHSEKFSEFLDAWRVRFTRMPVLMPSRVLESEPGKG